MLNKEEGFIIGWTENAFRIRNNQKDTDFVTRRDTMLIIHRFRKAATGVVNIFFSLKMNIKELITSLDRNMGSNVSITFDLSPKPSNTPTQRLAYPLTYSPFWSN